MLFKNRKGTNQQPILLQEYSGIAETKQRQQPKRLSMRHKYCILFHLEGMGTSEICEALKCSPTFVYNTINSDAAQEVISQYHSFLDTEFKALYALSIEAIRRGLTSLDDEVALKAADKFLKAHNHYDKRDQGSVGETAEDVIRRVFELRVVEERRGAPAREDNRQGSAATGTGMPSARMSEESPESLDAIESLCTSVGLLGGDGDTEQLSTVQPQRNPDPDDGE